MEYKKKLVCSVKAFIIAGASDGFITGFDLYFSEDAVEDNITTKQWNKFINWAWKNGHIVWLLEKGFIGEKQELMYRAGDKFTIKRQRTSCVVGEQTIICDEVMLICVDDYMRLSSLRTGVVGDVSCKCAKDGSITDAELAQLVYLGYGYPVFKVQVG